MLTKLATFRGVSPEGEPLVRLFRQGDSIQKLAGSMMPEVRDFLGTYKSDAKKIALLINAMGGSEFWGQNVNGDIFPWSALVHDCRASSHSKHGIDSFNNKIIPPYGYWTFLEALPFVHHRNKDPSRAFGKVVVACLNPRMKRVELVAIIDRALASKFDAQHVVDRIDAGEFPDVSMGCFRTGTRILLADGSTKAVEHVQVGDEVFTHLGRKRFVTDVMVRDHERIFRLKASGHKEMWLTEEHPLWLARREDFDCRPSSTTINRGRKQVVCTPESRSTKKGCSGCTTEPRYKFDWVRADEAKEGDYLAAPVPQFATPKRVLSRAEARLAGYYLAEGHPLYSKAGNLRGIQFSTGLHEKQNHAEIYELAASIGLGENVTSYDVPERNGRYISIWGAPELAQTCLDLCGRDSSTKRLSEELLGQPSDVLLEFLGAYSHGDGGCYKGSLYFSTASEVLAGQLAIAAMRCGLIPSVNELVHKPSALVPVSTVEYQVWIGTDTAWKVSTTSRHPVRQSEKMHSRRFFYESGGATWLLTPIEELEEHQTEEKVYNFSVEGHESYVAEGLAVHNCRVPYDVCSICGNKSKTRNDYCQCVKSLGLGRILEDGRQVGVVNLYPRFFDISFVFIGADKTAKVMVKLGEQIEMTKAESGIWVPASVVDGERIYGVDGELMTKAASGMTPGEELVRMLSPKKEPRPFRKLKPRPPPHEGGTYSDGILQTNHSDATGYREDPRKYAEVLPMVVDEETHIEKSWRCPHCSVRIPERGGLYNPDLGDTAMCNNCMGEISMPKTAQIATDLELEKDGSLLPGGDSINNGYANKEASVKIGPPPSPNRKEHPFVGTISFRGLRILVENKPGDARSGVGPGGKRWQTKMLFPYGEIEGAKGADKDALDVYVGPHADAKQVFIVHQNFPRTHPRAGEYDEDKVMLGFRSAEEAKSAYHAHYDRKDFFRSLTVMDFGAFKQMVMSGEIKGEKVAGLNLAQGLTKEAQEFKLEELFLGADTARRRQRAWKDKVTGKETHHVGSGLGDSFATMQKTASILDLHPVPRFFRGLEERARRRAASNELADEIAVQMAQDAKPKFAEGDWTEILKRAAQKAASHFKEADIDKEIEPSTVVGRVAPLLADQEEKLPNDVVDQLAGEKLEHGLATASGMGMVLRPREFQRLLLVHIGKRDLADKLESENRVFAPSDDVEAPCGELGPGQVLPRIISALLPFLAGRSFLGPVVRRRLLRIEVAPVHPRSEVESESPLLSKISAAYNYYRQEMLKVAAQAPSVIEQNPALAAAVFGMSDADVFSKQANDALSVGTAIAAVPLTLMYSSSLRKDELQGKELGLLSRIIAEYPNLSALAAASLVRELMKNPGVHDTVQRGAVALGQAAKKIWTGGA
jgi:hypothetical protein